MRSRVRLRREPAFAPNRTMRRRQDSGEIGRPRRGAPRRPVRDAAGPGDRQRDGLLGVTVDPTFSDEPSVYAYYTGTDVQTTWCGYGPTATAGPRSSAARSAAGHGPLAQRRRPRVRTRRQALRRRRRRSRRYADRRTRTAWRPGPAPEPRRLVPRLQPARPGNSTFALGIRNSFGLCFDASGGLWEKENGPTEWDEINLIRAGGNYGWPEHLGSGGDPEFVPPSSPSRTRSSSPDATGWSPNGGLFFGKGFSGNLHRMVPPGPGGRRHHAGR